VGLEQVGDARPAGPSLSVSLSLSSLAFSTLPCSSRTEPTGVGRVGRRGPGAATLRGGEPGGPVEPESFGPCGLVEPAVLAEGQGAMAATCTGRGLG
jgi:hypothetical protein